MPPFGFSQTQWDQAKEEMRRTLIATAQAQEVISYSDVVQHVQTIRFEAHDKRFFEMLGEISTQEDAAGRGMLSVVVVHKQGDMQPGPGFFELAKKLRRDTHDVTRCWIEELKRVYVQWQRQPPTPLDSSQELPNPSVFRVLSRMISRLWVSIFGDQSSVAERLQELQRLFKQGLISQEDYEQKKADILKEV
jgi:hypothetical protein